MIDLKKTGLPESIEVEGSLYYIQTSFKYWLRFLELIENKDTSSIKMLSQLIGKMDYLH